MVEETHKNKEHTLTFTVVPKNVPHILGLYACERLNLVKRVLVVETDDDMDYDGLIK